jgi:hypothetical protein
MPIVKKVTLITLLVLVVSPTARAGFLLGNDLYNKCIATHPDPDFDSKWGECIGYILGATDAHDHIFCLSPDVTAGQVRDTVIRYLQINPSKRHLSAEWLVADALLQSFPCR